MKKKKNNLIKKKNKDGKAPNNRQRNPINKKNKLHIKFDSNDRRQYLKGFQKRKKERREYAYKKLAEELKEEMKRAKKDRISLMKKLIYGNRQDSIDAENAFEEDITHTSCGTATVEISSINLNESPYHIGINKMSLGSNTSTDTDKTGNCSKEEQEKEEEEEEELTKDKLDSLGIYNQKDLHRSFKRTSMHAMKQSKLMKKKMAHDSRKQRRQQARIKKIKSTMIKKREKHRLRCQRDTLA